MKPNKPLFAIVALLALALAACGSTPDRRALYLPPPDTVGDASPPLVRVTLPRHVEHRSLRVRAPDHSLQTLGGESWAESPSEGFERLLGEQLAARTELPAGARVELQLSRFEREADGVFRAFGHWRVARGGEALHAGVIRHERELPAANAASLVAAMSAVVGETADAITLAIRP